MTMFLGSHIFLSCYAVIILVAVILIGITRRNKKAFKPESFIRGIRPKVNDVVYFIHNRLPFCTGTITQIVLEKDFNDRHQLVETEYADINSQQRFSVRINCNEILYNEGKWEVYMTPTPME